MKLDLGAGRQSPDGYMPLGRDHGSEIFPLPFPDSSIDAVRASHCLEHFPHAQIPDVLAEWVRVLKPGGRLRIAVPDFAKIAKRYQEGAVQPTEAYIMGGQVDASDFHKALFDEPTLSKLLSAAGLLLIRRWHSEIEGDCAALPISLNLEGAKPHRAGMSVSMVMSLPRLTWTANTACNMEALSELQRTLRITPRFYSGAYWEQCLERAIEESIEQDKPDAILTLDYDTIFTPNNVRRLVSLMMVYPEADAIAPIQAARGNDLPLFTMAASPGADGPVPREIFGDDLTPVRTAHFGLTLLSAAKLRALPKPWFHSVPAPDGTWGNGRRDADIAFWQKWAAAGHTLFLGNRVTVGHLELMVKWPGADQRAIYQEATDWRSHGAPADAWK
jgi:hypothetical protein